MDMQDLLDAWRRRDVRLLDPASADARRNLETSLGIAMDAFFRDFYAVFGGFACLDDKYIALWPLSRIGDAIAMQQTKGKNIYVSIGDVLIESDLIAVCLADSRQPAFLYYEDRMIAATARQLIEKLADGTFEW